MKYIKVTWRHNLPDEPVTLYSELGEDGYEVRKVEVFRDGTMTYADSENATGDTWLAEAPVPPIEEIAAQDEFTPELIAREEFERVWEQAHQDPAAGTD